MKTLKKLTLLLLTAMLVLSIGSSVQAAAFRKGKKKITLSVGDSKKLAVNSSSAKVKWKSSAKKIVSVNKKGLIKAKKAGKATITATLGKKKATWTVTVKPKKVLYVDKSSLEVDPYGSVVITFLKTGYDVDYDVEDPDIVDCEFGDDWYDNHHKINLHFTGLEEGTTDVVITNSYNNESVTITVNVTEAVDEDDYDDDDYDDYDDDDDDYDDYGDDDDYDDDDDDDD